MRLEYWKSKSRDFMSVIECDFDTPTWMPVHTSKKMAGEILFDTLPDFSKYYEVTFYNVDSNNVPLDTLGDMDKNNITIIWCDNKLTVRYLSHRIVEFENITFNKFKLIIDNLNINDYVRTNHPNSYSKYNPVYDLVYVGKNKNHNFFNL